MNAAREPGAPDGPAGAAWRSALRARRRDALSWFGLRLCNWTDGALARYSAVGNPPVFDTALFPWARELERNWRSVRAELDRVLADREGIPPVRAIARDNDKIARDERWRSFLFWGFGQRCDENCSRCPETARLVDNIPGLQMAFFSILSPGAHIPLHIGLSKSMLTAHLALRVPKDSARCTIQVGEEYYHWQEGRVFIFDDMYDHQVWNNTDEDRVVLLMNIKRPERFPGSLIQGAFLGAVRHSPYVKDGTRSIKRWAQEALERDGRRLG